MPAVSGNWRNEINVVKFSLLHEILDMLFLL